MDQNLPKLTRISDRTQKQFGAIFGGIFEIKKIKENFCGFGGVIPFADDLQPWSGMPLP